MVYGRFHFLRRPDIYAQFLCGSEKNNGPKPDTLSVHARAPATPCFFINP